MENYRNPSRGCGRLLEIDNLTIHYETDGGTVHAVENLNLSVGRGEVLGLVGETGAGKTTAALGVLRLLPRGISRIKGGRVVFNGENLLDKTEEEMRRIRGGKIAMIFQDPMTSLNPLITVDKQVSEMIRLHRKVSDAEAERLAGNMLELVGIQRDRMRDYPHQFSGGMKQRVVIAIALACDPQLLIADEPTTALDVTIQAQVLELMKKLKDTFDASMILITHDLGVVAEICDKVAIMYAGRIVEYAGKRELFTRPAHPYTIGLFNSVPDVDDDIERLNVIPGLMPDPIELPTGCAFHERCRHALPECAEREPGVVEAEPGHLVACPRARETEERGGARG